MKSWTKKDVEIAEGFIELLKNYDVEKVPFIQRMTSVAKSLGYVGYNDPLLEGVRKYIAYKGGTSKRKNKHREITSESQLTAYMKSLLGSEDMQHSLHPEDEAHLIEQIVGYRE